MLHVCAIQVWARVDAQLRAKVLVICHAVGRAGTCSSRAALNAAIDDVDRDTEARSAAGCCVAAAGAPIVHHNVVAGGFRVRCRCPEPECSLEGDCGVGGHQVRVAQDVATHGCTGSPVVVVPVLMWKSLGAITTYHMFSETNEMNMTQVLLRMKKE